MRRHLIVVLLILAALAIAQAVLTQDARAQAGVDCRGSNYELWEPEECGYGTLIVRTNETWDCNGQLMGDLPIKVVVQATRTYSGFGITLNSNCNQPANWDPNRIALIGDVRGTGNTGNTGPNDDSWKMRPLSGPGPQFLTMTIRGECGRRAPNAHSDSGQLQIPQTPNARVKVYNFRTGNFDGEVPTCQGAGGAPFWSSTADVDFIGARVITCNHALNGGRGNRGSGSEILDSDFRTGSANHPNCAGIATSAACINTGGMLLVDVTCDSYPFAPSSPPPPPPPPPPPAPAPTLAITQTWGERIRVSWPALQNVERFNFSRDSTFLSHTLNGNAATVIFGRVAGTHSYCVEAVYAGARAGKSCVVSTK